ncbi:MAG: diacylglycerol kinase family lipid kinase [Pedosphaera sp.]|nr:diacylglycerol kinase family lipid kinase [Pedosphaera sp.]
MQYDGFAPFEFNETARGVIAIVFNPTAGGNRAAAFLQKFKKTENACFLPTRQVGDAIILAEQAISDGATTVVAVGGDGTVNEVVNGIARHPDGLRQARLAVLPLGTINVFAKELNLPTDLDSAWHLIISGSERRIDLPYAIWPGGRTRYFIQMAGAGVDSISIGRVRWSLKKSFGQVAYFWACAETYFLPRPTVVATLENEELTGQWIGIGNGRFLGGRFPVFPRAQLDDGFLDIAVFPKVTLAATVRVVARLLIDSLDRSSDVIHRQVRSFTLRGSPDLLFQVEGDIVGELPVSIHISPGALRVVAPVKK